MTNAFFARRDARAVRIWTLIIPGLVSFAFSAVFYLLPGSSFLGLFFAAAGIFFFVLAALDRLRSHARWRRAAFFVSVALRLCAALFILTFILIESMLIAGGRQAPDTQAEYAVVFGAGLRGETPSLSLVSRLRAAVGWLEENPSAVVVVTGGQGPGESITEAQAMRTYLESAGIDPRRILTEDKARDTEQNAKYAGGILRGAQTAAAPPAPGARIAVITNEFHIYRAARLMEKQGFIPVAVPAPTPYAYLKAAYYVREYFSVIFMWLGL